MGQWKILESSVRTNRRFIHPSPEMEYPFIFERRAVNSYVNGDRAEAFRLYDMEERPLL
jgi:hypothetical protein